MLTRQPLPTGVVTFLLTDIEGSTRLWEREPEAMRAALERHDAIVATAVRRTSGHVIKSKGEGDSVFSAFAQARNAVAAAVVIQTALGREPWVTSSPIRVRMAIHTGRVDLRGGDYFGPTVNRSARLRALAKGGEVLLSGASAQLVAAQLPSQASLIDLGTHTLKDLSTPERVWRLVHPLMNAAPTAVQPSAAPQATSAAAARPGRRSETISAPRYAYLLTDHLNQTLDGREWGAGVSYRASDDPSTWIRCYGTPALAGLLNPLYERFRLPRLWESTVDADADAAEPVIASRKVTAVRPAALPPLTGLQHARFAVLCAREAYADGLLAQDFGGWATQWLAGQDPSGVAAREIAEALEPYASDDGGFTRPGEMMASKAAWAALHATRGSWLTGRAREQEHADAVELARGALHIALRLAKLDLRSLADQALHAGRPSSSLLAAV